MKAKFDWLCMAVAAGPFNPKQRASWIADQTEHCKPRKLADTRTEDEIRAFEASRLAHESEKVQVFDCSHLKKGDKVRTRGGEIATVEHCAPEETQGVYCIHSNAKARHHFTKTGISNLDDADYPGERNLDILSLA